jgi:hypothetical protein
VIDSCGVRFPVRPILFLLLLPACRDKSSGSASVPPASASAQAAASVKPVRTSWPIPSGPRFPILAGQGVGPIRFGATVATIERQMEAPCDLKTPEVCRYFARALEFELKDGVVARIRIHRMDRPAGQDAKGQPRTYGVFNGAIPPDVRFGMLPWALREALGTPARIEQVAGGGAIDTRERYFYPGMILELDRIENGQIVLGGIEVFKPGS